MPGRVRMRIKELRSAPDLAQQLQSAFEIIPGIKQVETNTITGNLLVEYDTVEISSPDSMKLLNDTLLTFFPSLDIPRLLAWVASQSS